MLAPSAEDLPVRLMQGRYRYRARRGAETHDRTRPRDNVVLTAPSIATLYEAGTGGECTWRIGIALERRSGGKLTADPASATTARKSLEAARPGDVVTAPHRRCRKPPATDVSAQYHSISGVKSPRISAVLSFLISYKSKAEIA